jgi:hypothetical protein
VQFRASVASNSRETRLSSSKPGLSAKSVFSESSNVIDNLSVPHFNRRMKCALILVIATQLLTGRLFAANPVAPDNASHLQPQGSHGLRNEQYGLFLRPRDASNKTGEPIVLYPFQPWKCMAWHFDTSGDGVRLVNYFTSKSFEVDTTSSVKPLLQQPSSPDHRLTETLHFIPLDGGLYEIEAPGGTGVLTAIDSDGHGDIRVIVSPWKHLPAQQWRLVDIPAHFTM